MPAVTVVGSLHYDILIDAPDRPRKGETVTGAGWRPKFGGKGGNQAVAAARAGAKTAIVSLVGDDAFGPSMIDNLIRHGVDVRFVGTRPGAGSGMSVAIFDSDRDYGAVIVSGANLLLDEKAIEAAAESIRESGVLILQNEIPEAANHTAAAIARRAGVRVLLNAAPARQLSPELEKLVDILVVNAGEAEAMGGVASIETLTGALEAARRLATRFAVVVVTAGPDGVACAVRQGEELSIPGITVRVESTHGAGDEFVGWLAAGLAEGLPLRDALIRANEAAAALVATPEGERG